MRENFQFLYTGNQHKHITLCSTVDFKEQREPSEYTYIEHGRAGQSFVFIGLSKYNITSCSVLLKNITNLVKFRDVSAVSYRA